MAFDTDSEAESGFESAFDFDPEVIIERFAEHHSIDPIELLAALLEALARYHLLGANAYPTRPASSTSVFNEISALSSTLRGGEHGVKPDVPISLLSAIAISVDHEQQKNMSHCQQTDSKSGQAEAESVMHCQLARRQQVLLLILRDCMNTLDAIRLEGELAVDDEDVG